MHLLFSLVLTGFHTPISLFHWTSHINYNWTSHINYRRIKNDNNLIGVTSRIFAFLSGCIPALLKAVCSPLKKILAVNIRNLLQELGYSAFGRKRLQVCIVLHGHLIYKVYLLCQHNS